MSKNMDKTGMDEIMKNLNSSNTSADSISEPKESRSSNLCVQVCCSKKMRKRWRVAFIILIIVHTLYLIPIGWFFVNFMAPGLALYELSNLFKGIL